MLSSSQYAYSDYHTEMLYHRHGIGGKNNSFHSKVPEVDSVFDNVRIRQFSPLQDALL
eukprot:m.47364 g.47364  ORF g.47364 m.47364 type:complete len:58 (-) comp7325_c0_seq1:32-205(-)